MLRNKLIALGLAMTLNGALLALFSIASGHRVPAPYFAAPGTNLSNPGTFGVINSASNSRAMQGGLKVTF